MREGSQCQCQEVLGKVLGGKMSYGLKERSAVVHLSQYQEVIKKVLGGKMNSGLKERSAVVHLSHGQEVLGKVVGGGREERGGRSWRSWGGQVARYRSRQTSPTAGSSTTGRTRWFLVT